MKSNSFAPAGSGNGARVSRRSAAGAALAFACVALLALAPSRAHARQAEGQRPAPQRFTREGVTVEFTIEPAADGKGAGLMQGREATVKFKITDAAGKPVVNLRPAGWMDTRASASAPDEAQCRKKVQSFLQAGLTNRPAVDLNAYFILALNHEPNISVIDPLSGFGTTKLYTLVALHGPGEDWVLSSDRKRLYVSVPGAGQVAVVDTATWKTLANVEAGARPVRLALQRDEKYLWVGNDVDGEAGGVTVIDTGTHGVAARIRTGRGPHQIAFSDDDRRAFVTNKASGTLTVIDVRSLAVVKEHKVGARPTALAVSPLGRAVYVVSESDGAVTVVSASGESVVANLKSRPGLHAIRFTPDGRFGFVVNRAESEVYVFDAATNRLVHSLPVEPAPDQITFTKEFAYVRATGSEFISMIRLSQLGGAGGEVAADRFPAGQRAPRESNAVSSAASVVPAPEPGAVLAANPADKTIYYYNEGMAAPMGSFTNYRRDPRAVLVLDKSLRETAPGVYATTVRLGERGEYDVAFLLDTPRVVNCFSAAVKENPEMPKQRGVPIRVETVAGGGGIVRVGEAHRLRLKVTDVESAGPADVKDLGALVFLTPGIWQTRETAKPVGAGLYEISFVPPRAGVYYVYFQAPSLGVKFNHLPFLTIRAASDEPAPK